MAKRAKVGGLRSAFGKNVRRARRERDLSQEALGELAGLHRTYISEIESGARNVSIDAIERLADALGLLPSDLLRR